MVDLPYLISPYLISGMVALKHLIKVVNLDDNKPSKQGYCKHLLYPNA
jgi:hypothetical protein